MKSVDAKKPVAGRVRVFYVRSGHDLANLKNEALQASSSARAQPVADVRAAYGFMPLSMRRDAVIHWPAL